MKKWSLVAVLLASTVLVGCTGDGAGVAATTWPNPPTSERPNTPTPSPSSASSASSPSRTSGSSVGPTSDPAATITPPSVQEAPFGTSSAYTTTAAPQTSGPWPATFTGEQVQWSEEAWAAWSAYEELSRKAYAAPHDDWSTALADVAVNPWLNSVLASLGEMRDNAVTQTGFFTYERLSVPTASSTRVDMVLCSDLSSVVASFADGTAVPMDTSSPRTTVRVAVVRDVDGLLPWLVAEFEGIGDPC